MKTKTAFLGLTFHNSRFEGVFDRGIHHDCVRDLAARAFRHARESGLAAMFPSKH